GVREPPVLDLRDVNQPLDASQVDEGAKGFEVLDRALQLLPDREGRDPSLGRLPCFALQQLPSRQRHAPPPIFDSGDQELERATHVGLGVGAEARLDLGERAESARASQVDAQPAGVDLDHAAAHRHAASLRLAHRLESGLRIGAHRGRQHDRIPGVGHEQIQLVAHRDPHAAVVGAEGGELGHRLAAGPDVGQRMLAGQRNHLAAHPRAGDRIGRGERGGDGRAAALELLERLGEIGGGRLFVFGIAWLHEGGIIHPGSVSAVLVRERRWEWLRVAAKQIALDPPGPEPIVPEPMSEIMPSRSAAVRHVLAAALALTVLNALKPPTIDDPSYLRHIQQTAHHPLDPYGGEMFFLEIPGPAVHNVAPPVFVYWMALGARITGDRPQFLKLWVLPFALLLLGATYDLLRRFARGLERAGLWLLALSPAILPSLNLMLDVPALALSLAAIASFLRAADRGSPRLALAAGAIAGLAIQTKYTGFTVGLVLLAIGWLRGRFRLALV